MAAIPITHVLSAAMVEARGFCDAVCLARGGTEEDFVVEGDAKEVVQMLQGLKNASSSLAVHITDVINLARHFHYVSISFVRSDCNRFAHAIAKYALAKYALLMEFPTTEDGNFPKSAEPFPFFEFWADDDQFLPVGILNRNVTGVPMYKVCKKRE